MGLNPFERAVLRRDWSSDNVSAQIHALMGDDGCMLVEKAGRIMYVVLGAAVAERIASDDVDVRILRGAVNALAEQAGIEHINEQHRASIASGLQASERLNARLDINSIFKAVCFINTKLKVGDVTLADFEALATS